MIPKSALIAIAVISAVALIGLFYYVYYKGPGPSSGITSIPPLPNGINQASGQQYCINGVTNNTIFQYMSDNGIKCFRIDIYLNQNESSFVSNSTSAGAQYLGILDYATVGAQPSRSGCISGCNWTLSDWNASVANAVMEYPEVNTWEIYNEPLAGLFVSGYDNGSALNYFNMIKSAYTIIKGKEPNATIVCFGGAEMFPGISVEYEYPFYRQVWQYGASKYCDAVSLHTYSAQYYDLGQAVAPNLTLGQFYNITLYIYENLTKKPVWITETGVPSNNWTAGVSLSEQKQASFLTEDMNFFRQYPYVRRVYWFDAADRAGSGADYGLINATLRPKPALQAFLYFSRNGIS
ncbi:MAG: cellulase family glycosylhydrolase [Candidatus Micrarchaeota archaeon]|nr:cellulase family glycosylhydrolase [Candidatus Micrarchaeota archaeon]